MTSPDAAHGMVINLGTVNGTARITVNGTVAGSQIMDQPGWDIADLLRPVKNTLSTTLRNAVSTYDKKSATSQPSGIRGPVTLSPVDTEPVYKSDR